MDNKEKLTFWKKLKFSIFDFEKYQDLATEKIIKTIGYISILIIVFTLIITGIYTYKFSVIISNIREFIDQEVETIELADNELSIIFKNNEENIVVENETIGVKVLVNTKVQDKKEIDKIINDMSSQENGIVILKDKVLIVNDIINNPIEYSYGNLAEQYNINKIDKQEVISLLSADTIKPLLFTSFIILLIYFFLILYLPSTLIDIVILSVFGYIVSNLSRMRLKYSALYNIASYSVTLPIILNCIYAVVNNFTGFTIEYFSVMYIAIATIYIVTAILMIRSDIIKKQIELTMIIKEQENVRAELQRKEEEQKEQEEREKRKKEEEQKGKQQDNKSKKNTGNEPEPEGNKV